MNDPLSADPSMRREAPRHREARPSLVTLRSQLDSTVAGKGQCTEKRRGESERSRSVALLLELAALPPLPADLLLLTAVGGYTMREAAAITGCSSARAHREALYAMRCISGRLCPPPRSTP